MKFLSLLLFALSSVVVFANDNNPLFVVPQGVGVNIHFVTGRQKDLDVIADAGFKWIRMDFAWESIEKSKGVYDWSAYDELTANLEKHGLSALYILDYSNPLYEEKVGDQIPAPRRPESVAAFAKWAAAAAAHYHGRHIIWEIWNEPNGGFWKPAANVLQYSALAVSTAAAVRAADPHTTIIGPACAAFDWPFLEAFLQSSVLENLDAVSVHPYRDFKQGPGNRRCRLLPACDASSKNTRRPKRKSKCPSSAANGAIRRSTAAPRWKPRPLTPCASNFSTL